MNIRKIVFLLMMSVFVCKASFCEDFSVSVSLTEDNKDFFKPVKAGNSISFSVKIINNRKDTCTVKYIKQCYTPDSWVNTNVADITLKPKQEGYFQLTIKVPTDAKEGTYTLKLDFEATTKKNGKISFSGRSQNIIIDNSAPVKPNYSVSISSYGIAIFNFDGIDVMSNYYPNTSASVKGIEKYNITIKNANNAVVKSESKKALDLSSYYVSNLSPNTKYIISITATDLAGNTSAAIEKEVRTAPKPPTVNSINAEYTIATISWNNVEGAVGYKIYIRKGNAGSFTLDNNTPVQNNSYTLKGLSSGVKYECYVIAINVDNVSSDKGNTKTICTEGLPTIEGGSQVCSTGSWEYKLSKLLSGYTVDWDYSSNLSLLLSSGSKAYFRANNTGKSTITATIKSSKCGKIKLTDKIVYAGLPKAPTDILGLNQKTKYAAGSQYSFSVAQNTIEVNSYSWSATGVEIYGRNDISSISVITPKMRAGTYDKMFTVWVCAKNACGSSSYYSERGTVKAGLPVRMVKDSTMEEMFISEDIFTEDVSTEVEQSEAVSGCTIYPNPTKDVINIAAGSNGVNIVEIYDTKGVLQAKHDFVGESNIVSINVAGLKQGVYLVVLNEETELKFIKE